MDDPKVSLDDVLCAAMRLKGKVLRTPLLLAGCKQARVFRPSEDCNAANGNRDGARARERVVVWRYI